MIRLIDILREIQGPVKKVRIFDFDDTLVKTDSYVYITKADGTKLKITPGEYATYEEQPGDQFDFSDFSKVTNPKLIKQNVDLLRQQVREGKKVVILTARKDYLPIKQFFQKMKLTPYVVALGSSDPVKKADYIEELIGRGYNDIAFMDDSEKNVLAVSALRNKYPDVKFTLQHYKEDL